MYQVCGQNICIKYVDWKLPKIYAQENNTKNKRHSQHVNKNVNLKE